jgi:hypothetical protein
MPRDPAAWLPTARVAQFDCLEAHATLNEAQAQELGELLQTERYQGTRAMAVTTFGDTSPWRDLLFWAYPLFPHFRLVSNFVRAGIWPLVGMISDIQFRSRRHLASCWHDLC